MTSLVQRVRKLICVPKVRVIVMRYAPKLGRALSLVLVILVSPVPALPVEKVILATVLLVVLMVSVPIRVLAHSLVLVCPVILEME